MPDAEGSLAESFINEMDLRKNSRYVRYGLPTLDEKTGGVKRKELIVLGAKPSTGKSAFALQLANRFRYAGEKVLFFPLEMSAIQNLCRLIVHEKLTEAKRLRSGKLTDEEKKAISEFLQQVETEGLLSIYEGKGQIETIEGIIKKQRPYAVIIDQLTQMTSSKRQFRSDYEHHQYMTANLKRISMQYNVAVILLHQIHRTADDKNLTMGDLKGSGSLEEDADNVLLLQRIPKEEYIRKIGGQLSGSEVPILLKLEKQRDGRTGEYIIKFKPDEFRFFETMTTIVE